MITLSIFNGEAFVWNADDWLDLRENHRIVGNLVGCLASLPRQDSLHGLPCILLPEEATLLVEKNLAKFVSYNKISDEVAQLAKGKYEEYKEKNKQEQISYYAEERKNKIISMIDRIVEGKRRKVVGGKNKKDQDLVSNSSEDSNEIDREAILKTELEKVNSIPITNTLTQTFTVDVWNTGAISCDVVWEFPKTNIEKIRYNTFKDLWEKEYFVTNGQKFGGDFLVYPGDPVRFHSQFIVICLDIDSELTAADVITYGRLGSSTRKTLIIASLCKESSKIIYQSLSWFDS